MTGLFLPPSVARAYRAPRVSREHWERMLAWEREVSEAMDWDGPVLEHWNRVLADIDPLLQLARAKLLARVVGVLPGFYHLVRLREPASATFLMVTPLTGPGGVFAEPTDAMLRGLRAADLQNRRAVDDRLRRDADAQRSKVNEEVRDDEDRRDQLREGLDAIMRTQVLMSSDVPWSQNNSPAARRARGEKAK